MTKLEEAVKRYQEAEMAASNAALAVHRARQEEREQTTYGFLVPERPKKENQ